MKATHFTADVRDFLSLLYEFDVKYLIIGGEAVIYYGNVRVTGDIDIYYKNDEKNINALYKALLQFWEGNIPVIQEPDDLSQPDYIIQFGVPPNRIDLLNSMGGFDFEDAWQAKTVEKINVENDKIPIYYIGLHHLIQSKKRADRDKDREDLKFLRRIAE